MWRMPNFPRTTWQLEKCHMFDSMAPRQRDFSYLCVASCCVSVRVVALLAGLAAARITLLLLGQRVCAP